MLAAKDPQFYGVSVWSAQVQHISGAYATKTTDAIVVSGNIPADPPLEVGVIYQIAAEDPEVELRGILTRSDGLDYYFVLVG